jgi:hypothetical protein
MSLGGQFVRSKDWFHMVNDHVISMPDKWEYPWYAAWDLAFHAIALTSVDPDFAMTQLDLMLKEAYLHPSGQIPAYEWNFSDVNPPVHAWAALFGARSGRRRRSGFSENSVQQAVVQLHVVGEPQRPFRQKRLRGRLSGSG